MRARLLFCLLLIQGQLLVAGTVIKTYYFERYTIESRGKYQVINFENTRSAGIPGEPTLPWKEIALMLPPGEAATSITFSWEDETTIHGQFEIFPRPNVRPISQPGGGDFTLNDSVYRQNETYPPRPSGQVHTQYLNGYAFALSAFTPVRYKPGTRQLSWFRKVTVHIETHADSRATDALTRLISSEKITGRARSFAQNPEMVQQYPRRKAPLSGYQYLIICPVAFKNEFQPLTSMYAGKGISSKIATVDSIATYGTGWDTDEKIRNFIIAQQVQSGIEYVLLAGNPPLVPSRGFYCHALSGGYLYQDYGIPADLYFSGLDGNYDLNGNHIYAEEADNPDLLPDIAVGRFTVNDTAELHHMIHKSVSYQTNPVLGEMNKPLLAGEYLYNNPLTFGGSYLNLLINAHSDNGYYTHGIPEGSNSIEKLFDTLVNPSPLSYWSWSPAMLLATLNRGKSFIHHLGHANSSYMMRFSISAITNANFSGVNGTLHNYELCYTQGCDCGAFDEGCIAARAVSIGNFLAAGIFNSRYGWFDEGTTEGPSEHLEREFVSALYDDTNPEKHIGATHMISKIKTAPWVGVSGEFEPGAQRWCHYDCNLFGDPALEIWTQEPTIFSTATWTGAVDSNWNNRENWSPQVIPTTLFDLVISSGPHQPVITTVNATFCHNLVLQGGGSLTISPGKSMVVYGTVTLAP